MARITRRLKAAEPTIVDGPSAPAMKPSFRLIKNQFISRKFLHVNVGASGWVGNVDSAHDV